MEAKKLRKNGIETRIKNYTISSAGCWIWSGRKDKDGYGRLWYLKSDRGAHRASYEVLVGPIATGLQLDHLCRNRACINPAHLEPVTCAENIHRGNTGIKERNKTACPYGHPYNESNIYWTRKGHRKCRTCSLRKNREYHRKVRALKD